jgi:hypothetical protein
MRLRHREDDRTPAPDRGDVTEGRGVEDGVRGCYVIPGPAGLSAHPYQRGRLNAAGIGIGAELSVMPGTLAASWRGNMIQFRGS